MRIEKARRENLDPLSGCTRPDTSGLGEHTLGRTLEDAFGEIEQRHGNTSVFPVACGVRNVT
jgi:hypothetical protein